jgi:hypothetical protein
VVEEAKMEEDVVDPQMEDLTLIITLNAKSVSSQITLQLIAGIETTLTFRLKIPKFKPQTLMYLKHHHQVTFKRHMVLSQVKTFLLVLAETMDMVFLTTIVG